MKIIKLLFASLYTAIPLMGIYAIAIAVATFIENDYGSNAARVLIYNTWFFNVLHLWLLVCLVGVLIRYKFLAQKKYASFILHLSFVIIILGAGITRFFGVEGLMNIREGESNSSFVSSEVYLNILLTSGDKKYAIHIPTSVSYAANKKLDEKITFGDSHFRIKSTAITKLTSDKKDPTAQMEAVISYEGKDYPLTLIGGGQMSKDSVVSFDDGTNAILSWGARDIDLGFSIKLEDFILERYAGSNSPSSYKSKVVVIDGEKEMPYEIFMNNVLDYKGYRFFQSSYDMDELGTILSVNNDPGKIPTYIGYFLLFVACVWLLFAKNSRFQKLSRFLKSQKIYSVVFALLIGFATFGAQNLNAESPQTQESTEAIQSQNILDYINNMRDKSKAHAQKFGTIQIQSGDGKIKPLDTLASDLVHKMTKKHNFLGFSNTQIALGMLLYPNDWKNIKMIRVSTPQLRELLGLPKDEKYASFMDLFIATSGESSASGEYKLKNYIEEANRKSPANRSKFDNDIIDVDERANIAYGIYSSQFFRFLPILQNGEIWISPIEMLTFAGDELRQKIQIMLSNYYSAFEVGLNTGDFEKADEALQIIKDYQREFGGAIMISDSKLKAEIFLNNSNLFAKLILPYILVGIAMFILIFAYIFKPNDALKRALKCFYIISCAIVLVHLFALILRWYISGHAPWSNAYESMLYIAFTAGIAGVVLFRKSYLALSSANFLAGMALFVANLGFMNPQITNLMPVLKSYWLNIHVSVITASYGFLGLCFLLGVVTLMLMIFRKDSANFGANLSANQSADSSNRADLNTANLNANQANPTNLKIDSTINSITAINEMSMIFGLFLLTTGNFLGGIWANESWGRYWGWDPKETWALVSIGVYAIILHLRFICKRNLQYIFATASSLGFFSLLMTYFGVNYYLSGLHSYAAGDPLPIPKFLYFMVAFLVILIIIAFSKRKMEAIKI